MAFIASRFSVPQNPIVGVYDKCGGLGSVGITPRGGLGAYYRVPATSIQGLSCGSCNQGMGALEIDLNQWVQKLGEPSFFGWPLWTVLLGGVVVVMLLTGRGKTAQSAYQQELAQLKAKYPRRGTRYARAAKAGYRAGRAIGESFAD